MYYCFIIVFSKLNGSTDERASRWEQPFGPWATLCPEEMVDGSAGLLVRRASAVRALGTEK